METDKKILMTTKHFLQNEQKSWSKDEIVQEFTDETKLLQDWLTKDYVPIDECRITRHDKYICYLPDFLDLFSDIFIEKFYNVLDSFIGEDMFCYDEEE